MAANDARPGQRRSVGLIPARSLAILGAMLAAAVTWGVIRLLGVELWQPAFDDQPPEPLGLGWTLVVSGLAGVAALGVLAVIERVARRPARVWLVVAGVLFVVSLGGPLSGEGIDTGNRIALASMHLAAAAVLVPALHRTARSRMGVESA